MIAPLAPRIPTSRALVALTALALLAGCGDDSGAADAHVTTGDDAHVPALDASATDDAHSEFDASATDDAAIVLADAHLTDAHLTDDAYTPTTACGGARPAVSGVTGTEGLVISREGSIYFSQRAAIGRLDADGTLDTSFVELPRTATQVWGMVFDAANEHLYVGSPSSGSIYDVDLTATPPAVTALATGVGGPNGLTLGPDGALYFSDFTGGRVMRVGLEAGATPTVVGTLRSANGVAFDDEGRLLVCGYSSGTLVRLTLSRGVESARETVASRLGSPDGVALDRDGTIYVTDNGAGRLLRIEADGSTTTLQSGINAAASLEFGTGALDCEDLYVASGRTLVRYEAGTTPGRAVPWH